MKTRKYVIGILGAISAFTAPAWSATAQGTFNEEGNVLIADQFNNRVIEVDGLGHIVWSFGNGSSVPGPTSVVAPNDAERLPSGKKLKPDEVGSGTFTITNPGIFGEQFGTPIINQPESAILGVGGLFKEPAVVTGEDGSDSIAVCHMIHLTLGFDHRIVDGREAVSFLVRVTECIENPERLFLEV